MYNKVLSLPAGAAELRGLPAQRVKGGGLGEGGERGTEGRRDEGTEGRRDGGTEGRREGRKEGDRIGQTAFAIASTLGRCYNVDLFLL